jgi:hypothetical protein
MFDFLLPKPGPKLLGPAPKAAVDDPLADNYFAYFVDAGTKVRAECECGCRCTYSLRYSTLKGILDTAPMINIAYHELDPCEAEGDLCKYNWIDSDACYREFIGSFQRAKRAEKEAQDGARIATQPAV